MSDSLERDKYDVGNARLRWITSLRLYLDSESLVDAMFLHLNL